LLPTTDQKIPDGFPKIEEFLIPVDQSISKNKFLTSTRHYYKWFSDSKWFWMIWFPTEDSWVAFPLYKKQEAF
jgi:hypothetical protein